MSIRPRPLGRRRGPELTLKVFNHPPKLPIANVGPSIDGGRQSLEELVANICRQRLNGSVDGVGLLAG
jgi:hypothetical protein